MRKPMITRTELARVADSFRDELARLHSQMDWPNYKASALTLNVNYSNDKVTWEVKCNAGSNYGAEVKGSDLGVVMDEVYRRLGYEHREEARIESSMKALSPPPDGVTVIGLDNPIELHNTIARAVGEDDIQF